MEDRAVYEDLPQAIAQRTGGLLAGVLQPAFMLVNRNSEPQVECLVASLEQVSRRMTSDPLVDLFGQQTQSE